jgi:hypothetical protein
MDTHAEKYGKFWNYLSPTQQDLINEGNYLMNDIIKNSSYQFKDYSFLVFPFAKAYEGFLKTLFKDIKFISHLDYISDHLRLGKLMSPHLTERLGDRSLYTKLKESASPELADLVWDAWKKGRNQVFHYYPHNTKMITFEDAQHIIDNIIHAMEEAYVHLYMRKEEVRTQATVHKLKTLINPES